MYFYLFIGVVNNFLSFSCLSACLPAFKFKTPVRIEHLVFIIFPWLELLMTHLYYYYYFSENYISMAWKKKTENSRMTDYLLLHYTQNSRFHSISFGIHIFFHKHNDVPSFLGKWDGLDGWYNRKWVWFKNYINLLPCFSLF